MATALLLILLTAQGADGTIEVAAQTLGFMTPAECATKVEELRGEHPDWTYQCMPFDQTMLDLAGSSMGPTEG
ncbi:MAG: hypothetical protein J0I48_15075 [Devosia sp.]|uniref:hypothetical protein n=1 Tax=Devosia sp. 66-22 TaxID=1895753 RepID=UPI00092A3532|nr:hypothetical protein [Devosia sp. 66-22]MBN9347494.1 hypothetical protein [Devosia sp.]OJX53642.1 MAG: hypothetical protein BGO81_13835 [Devosia sp. 66-22]